MYIYAIAGGLMVGFSIFMIALELGMWVSNFDKEDDL